ncbi:MAG: hypothetical protein AAGB93_13640 [Planctomycetota bacterium]
MVADVDRPTWNPVRPSEAMGGVLIPADRAKGEESFRLTVPVDRVQVSISSDVYGWISRDVEAVEGDGRVASRGVRARPAPLRARVGAEESPKQGT